MSIPLIDLDLVARELEALRPGWIERGVTVGPFTWRDALAAWPQPIVTDRVAVADPESLGMTMSVGEGEALLVLWRGGWAHLDLATCDGCWLGSEVISRFPSLPDVASCIALAQVVADELAALPLTSPARRILG